jgi:hypothetical protein
MPLNLTKINCITLKICSKAEFMSKSQNIWQQIILLCTTVMQMICVWPKIWTLSRRLSNGCHYFDSANFLTNFICRSLSMFKYDKYIIISLIITKYINKTYQHKNKCLLLTARNTLLLQKVIELVDDGYKMRFRHIQVCSTGIRAYGNRN